MRVLVDWERCEANAQCMRAAPEVFLVGDDDKLTLLQENPTDDLRNKVNLAIRRCPRRALSVVE